MATTRALEDFEIQAIFASISFRYVERNRAMLTCGIHLALRATELCGLRVGDLYDGKKIRTYVEIRPETAKNRKARLLRMSKDVGGVLDGFIDHKAERGESLSPSAPLFVSQKGGHLSRKMLFEIVKALFGVAGIRQSPHCLRKTGATIYYVESNYDLIATQQFLGHANPSTTRAYIGLTSEQLADYSERSGKRLLGAITGKLDTRHKLSNFDLEKAPTASLIWALADRGIDVSSLVSQVEYDEKVIPITAAKRARQ